MSEELITRIAATNDLYEILGVEKDADDAQLTKAYRKLAMKLHPDKCSLEGGDDAFKKVSNAFSILKDADQRAHYDRFGNSGDVGHSGGGGGGNPFGAGNVNVDDLFAEIFRNHPDFAGMRGGGGGNRRERRGEGMPGGMHFSFNGVPMGGMGGGGAKPMSLEIPEPFKTVLSLLGRFVPPQFLVLGGMFAVLYFATVVVGFLMRNLPYILGLMYAPLPRNVKKPLWMAFFAAGVFGYL